MFSLNDEEREYSNELKFFCSQSSIQKEEAKKKEVHIEDNVPAPSPRSNCSVYSLNFLADISNLDLLMFLNLNGQEFVWLFYFLCS